MKIHYTLSHMAERRANIQPALLWSHFIFRQFCFSSHTGVIRPVENMSSSADRNDGDSVQQLKKPQRNLNSETWRCFLRLENIFVVILLFHPCDLEWRFLCPTIQKAASHLNKFIFNRKPAIVERACLIPADLQVGLEQNPPSNGYLSLISGKILSHATNSPYIFQTTAAENVRASQSDGSRSNPDVVSVRRFVSC